VASRRRTRWLSRQAVETSHLSEVLARLGGDASVVVHAAGGRLHTGLLAEVGHDYVALRRADEIVYVARSAVAAVEAPGPARAGASSPAVPRSLGAALAGRAGEDDPVTVVTAGPIRGRLVAVGEDFLVVQPDGARPPEVYVPVSSVVEVSLRASG
jgi:hypothetical protein